MSQVLDFLNTADLNTLTQVQGVNRQLAGNLIAARPFDSEEDVLQVKGMGKATLSRLQSFAEAQEQAPENKAMIPVEEEAMPAPLEQSPSAQGSANQKESFLKRLWRAFLFFLNALVRLIMLVILILAVSALFYYGLPYLQRTFLAPVEANTAQIQNMKTEIESLRSQVDDLNTRVSALEESITAQSVSITKLEEIQSDLEKQMQDNNDATLLALKQEVMFARALDILARGRLYLAQSNFGLAKVDVQTARDLLAELATEKNDPVLNKALERLDLTLANLPDFPVVAAGDLEIAWEILISGNAPVSTATPTPVPFDTVTPTLVPSNSSTPTPIPVNVNSSPTPAVTPEITITATP